MKTPSLSLIFFVTLAICACENEWMSEVLESKTITFNSNGGSPVPSQVLYKGQAVTKPADPVKAGCNFRGWYEDNVTFLLPYDFTKIPLGNMILNAKWVDDSFKSVDELGNYLNGLPANTPANPVIVKLVTNDLSGIKDALKNAGKYVILDLSGSGINSIPDYAFSNDASGGTTTSPSYLVGITIPNSVTSIGSSAFSGCTNLKNITIPDNVQNIGSSAFEECYNLVSITIPNSVTSIGSRAFSGCSGLTGITIPNGVTTIEEYAFSWCSGLTNVTIPNSVQSIGDFAFYACVGLTSVTIENGVTSIGNYAFRACGLNGITIPDSVTTIGEGAFMECSNLTSITIPKNVFSIGTQAFSDCSGLNSVTIGSGVIIIGYFAFSGCDNLTSVTFEAGSNIIGENFPNNAFPNYLNVIYIDQGPGTYTKIGNTWEKNN